MSKRNDVVSDNTYFDGVSVDRNQCFNYIFIDKKTSNVISIYVFLYYDYNRITWTNYLLLYF